MEGRGLRVGRPGEADVYLAAEAEAQGQEAREEVLAPSDHAGEAPAQPSHAAPESVPGTHGSVERVQLRLGAQWGMQERKANALLPGSPGSLARRSSPSVQHPLTGEAGWRSRGAIRTWLHLRAAPHWGHGRRHGASTLGDFLRRLPFGSPPWRRANLQPLPACFPGRREGEAQHPGNF